MSNGPVYDPYSIVSQGWTKYSNLAVDAFQSATGFIESLGEYQIAPISFDNSFTPDNNMLRGFSLPKKPDEPGFPFEFELPDPIEIKVPRIPTFGSVPTFTKGPPSLDLGGKPSDGNFGPPPQQPGMLPLPALPSVPDLPVVDLPNFLSINIPDEPGLVTHTFAGERPTLDVDDPPATIDFQEQEYQSALLDRLTVEIKQILDTGTGMPAVVEQMVVDRAIERENTAAHQSVMEATERWSSKGFTLPSGIVNKDIESAHQNNQNQANTLSREVFVQRRQEEIEHFRFAISQGIALENMLLGAHMQVMQRSFEFARAVSEIGFRLLDAKIAKYNADIAGYRADADVHKTLIEAESQKLEQYRLRIQAESLKGQMNELEVRIYVARIDALRNMIQLYTAQVEAGRSVAQTNEAVARSYASFVEGYRSRIMAKSAEFEAWAAKIRGELGKVTGYEAETRAFVARVQGYQAGVEAEAFKPRLEIEVKDSEIRQAMARLEVYRSELEREAEKIRAETSIYGAKASMYAADGQIASNQSDANTRQFLAMLEQNRELSATKTAKAQIDIDQALRSGQILVSALDGAARSSSQLSAGMASAVNLGANISGSDSWSWNNSDITSHNTNINQNTTV